MKNLEIFPKFLERFKYPQKINNTVNFVPRQTLSIKVNDRELYISLICDDNFDVKVVLLDENNNIIDQILNLDGDQASITKFQNNLYVFSENKAYIYDIDNLKDNPAIIFLGNLGFQCVCANENNIFAYSTIKDKVIKYDKDLVVMQEYINPYSTENLHVSLELACNQETYFAIPIMTPQEEQYIFMKRFIEYYTNAKIAEQNDKINSCSYNKDENTLYISMYNIIWIIKNGVDYSYLYFKDNAITSSFYDNDIKKIIINFGGEKGNHMNGSIIKLSDNEIKEKSISVNKDSSTFQYFENMLESFDDSIVDSPDKKASTQSK